MFAFDIGFQIDLDAATPLVREATRQHVVRARRPAPIWFDYTPAPVRLIVDGGSVVVGGMRTEAGVEMLIYDFGAAHLMYTFPLPATLDELPALAAALQDNQALLKDATERLERIAGLIREAIERPAIADAVEDFTAFAITHWNENGPEELIARHRAVIARAIEAETGELCDQQTARSTSGVIAYTPRDAAIVDWNGAVLFDEEPDDVLAVLQHANVELLELRVLDRELDDLIDHADETLQRLVTRRLWPSFEQRRMLKRFASVQTDAAVMFEGVNNAIKLLGNQYLARVYKLAAERLDLRAWQSSVQRKIEAADIVYGKMSDASSIRRLETLEWVIIILIAISILLPFTGVYG